MSTSETRTSTARRILARRRWYTAGRRAGDQ
jgi:hypothetical protein